MSATDRIIDETNTEQRRGDEQAHWANIEALARRNTTLKRELTHARRVQLLLLVVLVGFAVVGMHYEDKASDLQRSMAAWRDQADTWRGIARAQSKAWPEYKARQPPVEQEIWVGGIVIPNCTVAAGSSSPLKFGEVGR